MGSHRFSTYQKFIGRITQCNTKPNENSIHSTESNIRNRSIHSKVTPQSFWLNTHKNADRMSPKHSSKRLVSRHIPTNLNNVVTASSYSIESIRKNKTMASCESSTSLHVMCITWAKPAWQPPLFEIIDTVTSRSIEILTGLGQKVRSYP